MARWIGKHWIWLTVLGTAAVYAPLAGNSLEERAKQRNLDTLAEVMTLVQKHAVEPPTTRQTAHAAIQGMLHTLDPHSNFFSEDDFRRMREDQQGSFFGIGATISQRPDGVVVMGLILGGPAERGGLAPGDYIKEIDGKSTDGWNSNQVVQKLRGEKGTVVEVAVQRVGVEKLLRFSLTRAQVPSESVSYKFMLTPEVGLISIKEFAENTGPEFQKAVASLKAKGMKSLILDLRHNPGGILDAAVHICRQLLGPNELIVSQRGRDGRDPVEYRTERGKGLDPFPIVVLIDRNSASASEIVAGAVQDQDRGLVVGTTSWGKGLVQSSILIGRTRGLHLTTARYYTPSGRCIQRDYQHGLDDYYLADDNDRDVNVSKGKVFKTSLGRDVFEAGGITPDHKVVPERLSTAVTRIYRDGLFFRFALVEKARDGILPGQSISDGQMERFRAFLKEQNFPMADEDWREPKNQRDMRDQISYELQALLHGSESGFRYLCERDIQVKRALELLPEAEALLQRKLQLTRAEAKTTPSVRP